MNYETVWHGGLWRQMQAPPPLPSVTKPRGTGTRQKADPVACEARILAVLHDDWQNWSAIKALAHMDGQKTTRTLRRLVKAGIVETHIPTGRIGHRPQQFYRKVAA